MTDARATLAIRFETGEDDQGLTIELDEERNEGLATFAPDSNVFFRALTDDEITDKGSTAGNFTVRQQHLRFTHEEEVIFAKTKTANLRYKAMNVIRSEWLGQGLGEVSANGSELTASQEGYGILSIEYRVAYASLRLSSVSRDIPVLVWAVDAAGREGYAQVEFEIAADEDLQIVVRDICTGMVIAGAQVTIEGLFSGVTNAMGRVNVGSVPKQQWFSVVTTATGYKDSNLDALSNDRFMLE